MTARLLLNRHLCRGCAMAVARSAGHLFREVMVDIALSSATPQWSMPHGQSCPFVTRPQLLKSGNS
jgi:hypothetical protein